jgi:Fic family protein
MSNYKIPLLPLSFDFENVAIYKQLSAASRALAELKGVAKTIPNENILLNTLVLQEAKDSSEVENIVTTQDEVYQADLDLVDTITKTAQKEVLRYREAMHKGFNLVRSNRLLTNAVIKQIQQVLESNKAGFRAVPGTALKNGKGETIYTPPQSKDEIEQLMSNLEKFINDPELSSLDPLIKLPIIHHQFESIHPFYDGNGRTGRIINILYLVTNGLLDLPILYLSRYINHNKVRYYSLIQEIRDNAPNNEKNWEAWITFILKGIEDTANETVVLVGKIRDLMQEFKQKIRTAFGAKYNHELLNNLFKHPYTKIEYVSRDLDIFRHTAAKYLDKLVKEGLVTKHKYGKTNYYINQRLLELFLHQADSSKNSA